MLYRGDCFEVMKDLPDKSIDLVFTDPPYLLEPHGGKGTGFINDRSIVSEDSLGFISKGFDVEKFLEETDRLLKRPHYLIFCSGQQLSTYLNWFEGKGCRPIVLVWAKTNPIPMCNGKHLSDCEFIIYVYTKGCTFNNDVPMRDKRRVKVLPNGGGEYHPAEKPLDLLRELVRLHVKKGDMVLDPFMGSGSLGVAALEAGAEFIGIEVEDKYFNIAERRIGDVIPFMF